MGSGCVFGEVFEAAKRNTEEELMEIMKYYDFIEINPPSIMEFLVESGEVSSKSDLYALINKIIRCADKIGKMVVATGTCIHLIQKTIYIEKYLLELNNLEEAYIH